MHIISMLSIFPCCLVQRKLVEDTGFDANLHDVMRIGFHCGKNGDGFAGLS